MGPDWHREGAIGFRHTTGYAPTQRVELAMRKGLIWLTKQCTGEALAKAVHAALAAMTG
jgi:hypothetical protein